MAGQLHNEIRKEFQLERLILFSDAVFAIAITLLVIEVKIPEPHGEISDKTLLHSLAQLIPKFVGFVISFIFIGLYWTIHHRMFGFVTAYNRRLIILNLVFLFFIVLMPFSTGFYSEYAGNLVRNQLKVPIIFYVLNFCGVGFVNYFLWMYISNPKHKLTVPPIDLAFLEMAKVRALTVPLVFLSMLPVAYFANVSYAIYMPMLIPVIHRIFKRNIEKKYRIIHKKHVELIQ
jgi:uncharacterized membrane protein